MEVFCLVLTLGVLTFGPVLAIFAYLFSAERSTQRDSVAWIALTMLLFILSVGSQIAIGLSGFLFTFQVMMWGHNFPSTTEWQRVGWLAIPMTKMVAASAATAGAAWLWPQPRKCQASFPIALAFVAFAYATWPQFGY